MASCNTEAVVIILLPLMKTLCGKQLINAFIFSMKACLAAEQMPLKYQ